MHDSRRIRSLQNKIAWRKQIMDRTAQEIEELSRELEQLTHEPLVRVIDAFKEKEVEKELELEKAPRPKPKSIPPQPQPKREWKNLEAAQAEGTDRYWRDRIGDRYELAKRLFLSLHEAPRTYRWRKDDATRMGEFLEECPEATLDDIRVMLLKHPRSAPAWQAFSCEPPASKPQWAPQLSRSSASMIERINLTLTRNTIPEEPEENERVAYTMWRGMSESYQRRNPWKGRVFEPSAPQCTANSE